jgi:hypothetical protein
MSVEMHPRFAQRRYEVGVQACLRAVHGSLTCQVCGRDDDACECPNLLFPEEHPCWRTKPHEPHAWDRILVQPTHVRCPGVA